MKTNKYTKLCALGILAIAVIFAFAVGTQNAEAYDYTSGGWDYMYDEFGAPDYGDAGVDYGGGGYGHDYSHGAYDGYYDNSTYGYDYSYGAYDDCYDCYDYYYDDYCYDCYDYGYDLYDYTLYDYTLYDYNLYDYNDGGHNYNNNSNNNDNTNTNVNDNNSNSQAQAQAQAQANSQSNNNIPINNINNNNNNVVVNVDGNDGGGGSYPHPYPQPYPYPYPQPQPPVHYPAPSVSLSVSPSYVNYGNSATLSWSSSNANSCYASGGWSGSKSTSGSQSTGSLYSSKTYTLTCSGPGGSNSRTVTVNVNSYQSLPTVDIYASPSHVTHNGSTVLNWSSSNANSCYASGDWSGSKTLSGSETRYNITYARTYTITCTNSQGSASDSVTVTTSGTNRIPVITSFYANPSVVTSGNSSNLYWSATNANNCYASGNWSGSKALSGSQNTGRLYSNKTYTLTCSGEGGSVSKTVTVGVSGARNIRPIVVTNSETDVTSNSARLNGFVSFGRVQSGSTVWFEYGRTIALGSQTQKSNPGTYASANFYKYLSDLSPNTTYYFRAVAQNASGFVGRGSILSFTTGAGSNPTPTPTPGFSGASIEKEVHNLSFPNGVDTAIAAWAGNTIQYEITIRNTGTRDLKDLVVEDELSEYVEFKEASDSGDYDRGDHVVTWEIDIDEGETKTITVDVNAGVFDENVVAKNIATADNDQISKKTSNETLAIINLYPFVLTVNTDEETVSPGQKVDYEIFYKNEGEATLTDVELSVVLPVGTSFDGASEDGISEDNIITFDLGDIDPEESDTVTVVAKISGDVEDGEKLTVSATASYKDAFSEQQIDVNAYKTNEVDTGRVLGAGAAAVGGAFLPDSLLGWLLLIILIVILAILIRRAFQADKREIPSARPVQPAQSVRPESPTFVGGPGNSYPNN